VSCPRVPALGEGGSDMVLFKTPHTLLLRGIEEKKRKKCVKNNQIDNPDHRADRKRGEKKKIEHYSHI